MIPPNKRYNQIGFPQLNGSRPQKGWFIVPPFKWKCQPQYKEMTPQEFF